MLQVEEGFWAGDKKAEGALKHMITSDKVLVEPKYVDAFEVANYARLLVTSNNEWIVPAGFGERRFAVLDADDARANDLAYFAALRRELFEDGGCARFLKYLLEDVRIDFQTLRRPPATPALLEQQLESLEPDRTETPAAKRRRGGRRVVGHRTLQRCYQQCDPDTLKEVVEFQRPRSPASGRFQVTK